MLQPLFLRSQADRRIKKGHLWVYSNEVDTKRSPLKQFEPGQLVQLMAHNNRPLGTVFINPNALICGRLLTRDPAEPINQAFITKRLERALKLREALFPKACYRLCFGDSDGLPGLVIDRYGEHCVVQVSVAGFDGMMTSVLAALDTLIQPKGVVVRNNHAARELEGLEAQVETAGQVPEQLTLWENNTQFQVPALTGQKTGWFYDHRLNRGFLQNWVSNKRVLDVFSYVGGWGVQAATAGAEHVTCIDASQQAVDSVLHNAALNGVANKVVGVADKAVDGLKSLIADNQKFDVVVLDPPAFIKKRKDQRAGETAYHRVNELALRVLNRDGILVSASCSMPMTTETLVNIVHGAAHKQNRQAQWIYSGSQSTCHPVHPAIPETHYLKAEFFRV